MCKGILRKWLTKALPPHCAGQLRTRTCSHHTNPEDPSGSPGSWCRCWRHHWCWSGRGGAEGDSGASPWWSGGCHWGSHWHIDWHLWSHSCLSGSRMIIAILKCGHVTYLRPQWHKNSHKYFPPAAVPWYHHCIHICKRIRVDCIFRDTRYFDINSINTQSLKMQSQWFTIAESANNNWILFVNND